MNLCLYCDEDKMDPAVAKALGECPECGRDLLTARPAPPAAVRRDASLDAHSIEADYSDAPVEVKNDPVVHNAHEVLRFAIALVRVVQTVESFTAHDRKHSAILGFMTGSEGLDWVLRRRLGHLFEGRIAHVRGLSHKRGGHDPDAELRSKLDEFRGLDVARLAVVDEVVDGAQLRTAFLRIRAWHAAIGAPPLALHLVGVTERAPADRDEAVAWFNDRVLKGDDQGLPKSLELSSKVIGPVPLLAKDRKGQPLKDVERGDDGNYEVRRIWPGGYEIRCPNYVSQGGVGARFIYSKASLDQLFGGLVYAVCGFGYVHKGLWPESIKAAGCAECKGLLAEARDRAGTVARAVPSPERVSGRVVGPPDIQLVGHDGKPLAWAEDDGDEN